MTVLEEEKDEIKPLKKQKNPIYTRFYYHLPTVSLTHKARGVRK